MPTPTNVLILESAARVATNQTPDQYNYAGHKGLHLFINVTAITATPSVVFTIQGKDSITGNYYTLLVSAAIVATGVTTLKIYPGLVVAGNLAANDVLPLVWRVNCAHGDADSITYSITADLLP
jgi:hypothetical protein